MPRATTSAGTGGKTFSTAMLRMEIDVPDDVYRRAMREA